MFTVDKGVLYKENQPFIFLSADYPYYRDHPQNWSDRLDQIKEAGCNVVTFYVPWRHHHLKRNGTDVVDFDGSTAGNRDVIHFLELIHRKDLYAVVKPGPFIHAETNFGGLPDFVEGQLLGEAMLDHQRKDRKWHKVLPAPFDPLFDRAVKEWFQRVDEKVIKPFAYPTGPVIALQILNEGLYSDGQHSVLAYDYSSSGLYFHLQQLQEQYSTIEHFNDLYDTTYSSFEEIPIPDQFDLHTKKELKELIPYIEWAKTQNRVLRELYQGWGEAIQTQLPRFNNVNPPLAETKGFDYWLTRIVPEEWNIAYGFTNWIGVVSHDESAFMRYLLLVKRARGINLEENWGFSKLYDWRYRFHHIPFYQTVLAMGLGATGFNVYTGVSTDQWTDELDAIHERPYPDCSPISEHGEVGEKYEVLKLLNRFIAENADLVLEGKRDNEATWALYPPYSYLSSFGVEQDDFRGLGVRPPSSGHHGIESFMLTMLHEQREFGVINIETATLEELEKEKVLVLSGSFFMKQDVQHKLLDYVQNGGTLFFFSELPTYDENMRKYELLKQYIGNEGRYETIKLGKGKMIYYPENPFITGGISNTFAHLLEYEIGMPLIEAKHAHTFYYQKDGKGLLYILSTSQFKAMHEITIEGKKLLITLPAKGCAMIALNGEKIQSCLIKGMNDYDQSYVTPYVTFEGMELKADQPCDFYYHEGHEHKVKEVLQVNMLTLTSKSGDMK